MALFESSSASHPPSCCDGCTLAYKKNSLPAPGWSCTSVQLAQAKSCTTSIAVLYNILLSGCCRKCLTELVTVLWPEAGWPQAEEPLRSFLQDGTRQQ